MNIHEYQAKEILRKYGVAVLRGKVATTPEEAEAAARELGGGLCVVKAQIHAGGRGKAGGVKLAKDPQAVREYAAAMLGKKNWSPTRPALRAKRSRKFLSSKAATSPKSITSAWSLTGRHSGSR